MTAFVWTSLEDMVAARPHQAADLRAAFREGQAEAARRRTQAPPSCRALLLEAEAERRAIAEEGA